MSSFEITSITSPGAGQVYSPGDLIPVRYFYKNAPESNYMAYIGLVQVIDSIDQAPSSQPVSPEQFITGQYNYKTSNKAPEGPYYIQIKLMDYTTATESTVFKSEVFSITK